MPEGKVDGAKPANVSLGDNPWMADDAELVDRASSAWLSTFCLGARCLLE